MKLKSFRDCNDASFVLKSFVATLFLGHSLYFILQNRIDVIYGFFIAIMSFSLGIIFLSLVKHSLKNKFHEKHPKLTNIAIIAFISIGLILSLLIPFYGFATKENITSQVLIIIGIAWTTTILFFLCEGAENPQI